MSEFKELIKRFDKVRSYVRDFYIYGFKTRDDYQDKSGRTYDNERRRIESWFADHIRYEHQSGRRKSVFITLDSNRIAVNPLYQAWKSKSFTANDIMLHFFLLDLLRDGKACSVEELADRIQEEYQVLFDSQTVRRKLVEYEQEGLVAVVRDGRRNRYRVKHEGNIISPERLSGSAPGQSSGSGSEQSEADLLPDLLDAVCFFQAAAPFGFIGSTILDACHRANLRFRFRHDYLVHTLEDEVLLPLLEAVREKREAALVVKGTKSGRLTRITGTPLKILVSTQTGRRYLCLRRRDNRRLFTCRLDGIREVKLLDEDGDYQEHVEAFSRNHSAVWGVSFGEGREPEQVLMRIGLDENTEKHIIHRLEREGRQGQIRRIEPGVYEYTTRCWDAFEILPWAKSFTGRVLAFTCSNKGVEQRFWSDMRKMKKLYGAEEAGEKDESVF